MNSVLLCYLFAMYLMTFKEIIDKATSHDLEVLYEILSKNTHIPYPFS
jgi:hypothetical protein